jgi:hypothetical protein
MSSTMKPYSTSVLSDYLVGSWEPGAVGVDPPKSPSLTPLSVRSIGQNVGIVF